MRRELIQITNQRFQGFGCSDYGWVFKPIGSLVGESLEQMKRVYQAV